MFNHCYNQIIYNLIHNNFKFKQKIEKLKGKKSKILLRIFLTLYKSLVLIKLKNKHKIYLEKFQYIKNQTHKQKINTFILLFISKLLCKS